MRAGKQLHQLERFSIRLRQFAAISDAGLRLDSETLPNHEWQELADLLRWLQGKQASIPADPKLARTWTHIQGRIPDELGVLFRHGVCNARTLLDVPNKAVRTVAQMRGVPGFKVTSQGCKALWRLTQWLATGNPPPRTVPAEVKLCRWNPSVAERAVTLSLWEAVATALQLTGDNLGDLRLCSVVEQLRKAPARDTGAETIQYTPVSAESGGPLLRRREDAATPHSSIYSEPNPTNNSHGISSFPVK